MSAIVKKKDDDYVCELWGGSTKHPDSVFYMVGDQENKDHYLLSEYIDLEHQVYQWLLWIASTLDFPFHAKELVDYANEKWYPFRKEESEGKK